MNVVVVGCGKVGAALTAQLVGEGHNVSVADTNEAAVVRLTNQYDIMGVIGNGAISEVQEEAGIEEADLMIACTNSDEVNMLACLVAKSHSHASTIARIRNPQYEKEVEFLKNELNLSLVINPEKMSAREIVRILRFPSALEVEKFSHGQVEMVKMRVLPESPICNVQIKNLSNVVRQKILVSMIERNDDVIIPNGDTIIYPEDHISFIAQANIAAEFCRECRLETRPKTSAMLIGTGLISYYIAKSLLKDKSRFNLKVFDKDRARCERFSEQFPKATVLNQDATKIQSLKEEGIENADAFVSLTGIDEQNIIMSMYAKRLSKSTVITKISTLRPEIMDEFDIGSVIVPSMIAASEVVRFVRSMEASEGSDLEALYNVANGKAEVDEFIVKKDPRLTNIPIMKMKMRKDLLVAAIIRGNQLISPRGTDVFLPDDHVVVITTQKGLRKLSDILQ